MSAGYGFYRIRFNKKWTKSILQIAGFSGLVGTFGCVASGIWGARQINTTRQKWFSDDFVMTPETLRMPYKTVTFKSDDEVELEGWFIEQTVRGAPSKNIVMCCNPYNNHKSALLGIARGLWDAGFSVLLFDYRSHAKESYPRTIGYKEYFDAQAALGWVNQNKPVKAKIGLIGASMGGSVALQLAADRDHHLSCCATDCAFSSLKEVLRHSMEQRFPSISRPFQGAILEVLCMFNKFWYGYDPGDSGLYPVIVDVGPEKNLSKINIPLLVIHSANDSVVPVSHAYKIFEETKTLKSKKELIIVPETEHIGAYFKSEKQYLRRIVDFFEYAFESEKQNAKISQEDSEEDVDRISDTLSLDLDDDKN